MKLGISDARKWGEQHYLKLKSFGFDCYDFNMSNNGTGIYDHKGKDFEEYFKNQKRLADEAGITIWQVHGPWRYPPRDFTTEDRQERLEKMKLSIHAAVILGARYWVVHPLMPFGVNDILTSEVQQTREINLEFMQRLLSFAKHEGVTICLENMPFLDFSLSSPSDIAGFIQEINDPSFEMCLDTGHANVCKDWYSPAKTMREYGKHIKVLHVHDNTGRRDEHLTPLSGTVNWIDFSQSLKETDFQGVLSLECCPSAKLPDDICEDMYLLYYRIAKQISKY